MRGGAIVSGAKSPKALNRELNRQVKRGNMRLDRHSGTGRCGRTKKNGAGGKGTWGSWQDTWELDDVVSEEEEEPQAVQPRVTTTYLLQQMRSKRAPVKKVTLGDDVKELMQVMLAVPDTLSKHEKARHVREASKQNCRVNIRHPRTNTRCGVRTVQPRAAILCH